MHEENKIEGVYMKLYKDAYWRGLSKSNYFEGYYTRLVGNEMNAAFIFGISYSKDPHGFIQVYDGIKQEMEYFRFLIDECAVSKEKLDIQIGKNRLTDTHLYLDICGQSLSFTIDIAFENFRTLYDQGYKSIMGPLIHLPGLECYHGVVSMYHRWSGMINQKQLNGYSYIEKDYGKSMPTDWIWIHLTDESGISFMLSIAQIPYLGLKPTGFLGFYSDCNQTSIFASYTRARWNIQRLDDSYVDICIQTQKLDYHVLINRKQTVHLKAPVGGMMVRDIEESLSSVGVLTIQMKNGEIISQQNFTNGACEVVGNKFIKEEL